MTVVFSYLVIIFGFISPLVFILGIAYRIWKWKRLSMGFSWGLFPKPTNHTATSVLWKVFAWPTLFKADKFLWVIALCFHISILLLLVGHLGNFVDIIAFAERLGIHSQAAYQIGVVSGILAGIAIILFIMRRVFVAKAQQLSSSVPKWSSWI